MSPPAWLTARPIAHRGLHDRARGIVENSTSAAAAAVSAGYAIECDVQLTADGDAVVFHDFELDRLTSASGPVSTRTASELAETTLEGSRDRIERLSDWLVRIDAKVPVICEIKSGFDGDMRLTRRVADIAAAYEGPLALKSFDPAILMCLRHEGGGLGVAHLPLGIVAEAHYNADHWPELDAPQRRDLSALTHWPRTRPDFLSWNVGDLPHAAATLCRAMRVPVMTWTVRTAERAMTARSFADQIVFEGFTPNA